MDTERFLRWIFWLIMLIGAVLGVLVGIRHGLESGLMTAFAIWLFCGGADALILWLQSRYR